MGKSALGLCMAANLAVREGVPVGIFTLEMSKSEVTQRLMCSEAKVESQRLRTGKLAVDDWPRLTAACDKLAKAPIYVDDTGSINLMEIRSKARRLKSLEPNLGLILIDYLQLMTSGTTAENRVQEVSQISRSLKVLARDLDVPILAMSQLSRAVEQRHDKRPILSDLRESGSIEQDADLVMFIYRDEYYNDESDQQGIAEVNVAKHRNGPTDGIKLSFLKRYAKFSDLAAAVAAWGDHGADGLHPAAGDELPGGVRSVRVGPAAEPRVRRCDRRGIARAGAGARARHVPARARDPVAPGTARQPRPARRIGQTPSRARDRDRRRAVGRRGQGQDRRPARAARRSRLPLPGRAERRAHDHRRRRDVQAPRDAVRDPVRARSA